MGLYASTTGGVGLIPGCGAQDSACPAAWPKKEKKSKIGYVSAEKNVQSIYF